MAVAFALAGAGTAHAEGDFIAGVRFDPKSDVSAKVLFAFNTFVLDADGKPKELVTRDTDLDNASVAVDVAGNLILEVTGRDGGGHVQVLQNSLVDIHRHQINLRSGEAVFSKVAGAELGAAHFGVPMSGTPISGYLFFRGDSSFFSISLREDPTTVLTTSGRELVLMPGQSVKASSGGEPKVHDVVPTDASVAMRDLISAVGDIRAPKKRDSSIKVLTASRVDVAVETPGGLEHHKVSKNDRFDLGPKFDPLIMTLTDPKSRLSVEYTGPDKKEVREFTGQMTLMIYEEQINDGSVL